MSREEGTERLIKELGDPRRSNQALLALLARGDDAVPALAEFLRTSKPSSLSEPRLLAVEGLSILKGHEALEALIEVATETLGEIADPVVRLAEETVVSRAALALAEFPDEPHARDILFFLPGEKPLTGVAEAFEKVKDCRAIPQLAEWLEEDFVAEPARRAIVACGPAVVPALLRSLRDKHERYGAETGMSQRRRARILSILCELAKPASIHGLEDLLDDPIGAVRWNTVRLFLKNGSMAEQRQAFGVGMEFLDSPDSFMRYECEELLVAYFDVGKDLIKEEIRRRQTAGESEENFESRETTLAILLRIIRRGNKANKETGQKA